MVSFNMILPEMNQLITSMNAGDYKGLIILFFALAAAISRPFSGQAAECDSWLPVHRWHELCSCRFAENRPINGRQVSVYIGICRNLSAYFSGILTTMVSTEWPECYPCAI